MKMTGYYEIFGYAIVLEITHTSSDGSYITEERNISVCLDAKRAESDYNTFGIEDFFCDDELETIEEVTLRLEEWVFSDNPDDFSREEIKKRQLK